ncbi:MAG: HepT-like ribonuclease domain-containing protein [Rhodopila sp.]
MHRTFLSIIIDLSRTIIRDLSRIVAFRNVLIHSYATVGDRLVWGVVERDLPRLLATLTHMLNEAET